MVQWCPPASSRPTSLIIRSRGRGLFIHSCCHGRPCKSVTYAPFPLSYGLTGWPTAKIQTLFLKKEKHIHKYCFAHAFYPYIHSFTLSFRQCWERKRFTRARYRITQAIWDSSLGLFPLILCRQLLSSKTCTHAQTQSPVLSVTLLPSMFTDRIVVALSF